MHSNKIPPRALVGSVRRFGKHGAPYEIIDVLSDDKFRIRVIATGEEIDYAVADVLADPEEQAI